MSKGSIDTTVYGVLDAQYIRLKDGLTVISKEKFESFFSFDLPFPTADFDKNGRVERAEYNRFWTAVSIQPKATSAFLEVLHREFEVKTKIGETTRSRKDGIDGNDFAASGFGRAFEEGGAPFADFDLDKDGKITRQELDRVSARRLFEGQGDFEKVCDALDHLYAPFETFDATTFKNAGYDQDARFEEFDDDHDNEVTTVDIFVEVMADKPQALKRKIVEAATLADKTGDGSLNADEFDSSGFGIAAARLGAPGFDAYDANGNGLISQLELIDGAEQIRQRVGLGSGGAGPRPDASTMQTTLSLVLDAHYNKLRDHPEGITRSGFEASFYAAASFKKTDINGDGRVGRQEFQRLRTAVVEDSVLFEPLFTSEATFSADGNIRETYAKQVIDGDDFRNSMFAKGGVTFEQIDIDGDGRINRNELKATADLIRYSQASTAKRMEIAFGSLYDTLGEPYSKGDFERSSYAAHGRFEEFDTDKNGQVAPMEILQVVVSTKPAALEQRVVLEFDQADHLQQDGNLNAAEFQTSAFGRAVDQGGARFGDYDIDGDGLISKLELTLGTDWIQNAAYPTAGGTAIPKEQPKKQQ